MQQTSHRIYSFGEFALDLTAGCLLRDGTEVKLRRKAFETLVYLVENSNRLVSKNELIRVVWADAFVTDNSLVQCLKEVRVALRDEAHVLIKTVPRRGYIFAADLNNDVVSHSRSAYREQLEGIKIVIEEVEQGEASPVNQASDPIVGGTTSVPRMVPLRARGLLKNTRAPLAAGVLALTLVAGAVFYLLINKTSSETRSNPSISIENIKLTSLTSTGDVYGPVISPNGEYLAYTWSKKGIRTLRVQQVATGSTIDIAPPISADIRAPVNYWSNIFSADSKYIYYILADDGENVMGTLFRVPVLGGRSQKILNHVSGGGYESPDGRRVAFIRTNQTPGVSYLMTSNTDGTDQKIISTTDTNSLFVSLDWSPDGKNLLYGFRQYTPAGYLHYMAEIPAAGGSEYRITQPRRDRIIAAQWLPDKSAFIMNAVDPQTQIPQIYYVTYPDGDEQRITNDFNNYKGISIADDGRSVVAQINGGTTNLWVMPKTPRHAVPLASSTRGWYHGLSWTPANELVYDFDENGVKQIGKMEVDGSNRQRLTTGRGHNTDPSVTPDGRFIVFFSTRSGSGQIWRMTANGDDPVQLTHSQVGVFKPQTSPDGQWVYYTADVKGQSQVWKVPLVGGEETLVEDAPVELWSISPNGEMLAYSFFDKQQKKTRVAVRRIDSREPFRFFDISPVVRLQWTRDGRALAFVQPLSGGGNIWLQPLDGQPARPLTALPSDQWIASYAWSPSGETLAYTRANTTFDAVLIQLK